MSDLIKEFEAKGFSPAVIQLFTKHSSKLVKLGEELNIKDQIRWNNHRENTNAKPKFAVS